MNFIITIALLLIYLFVRNYETVNFGKPTGWLYGDYLKLTELDVRLFHLKFGCLCYFIVFVAYYLSDLFFSTLFDLVQIVAAFVGFGSFALLILWLFAFILENLFRPRE